MQVRLIVRTKRSRRVLTVNRPVAVIGRAKGCAVRIPASEVSRQHCRISQRDGFVVLEDLKSVNGTFLNGRPVAGAKPVRPGDTVEVGPLRFIVGYELTPAARAKLESFETDDALVPSDSAADVLEETGGLEWVEEGPFELIPESESADEVLPADGEKPTEYKGKKSPVLADDDPWIFPTDLHLDDLLEPLDDDDEKR
jgi:pSer/pThr/pTyr-binding forkhead associated (FHA) protein